MGKKKTILAPIRSSSELPPRYIRASEWHSCFDPVYELVDRTQKSRKHITNRERHLLMTGKERLELITRASVNPPPRESDDIIPEDQRMIIDPDSLLGSWLNEKRIDPNQYRRLYTEDCAVVFAAIRSHPVGGARRGWLDDCQPDRVDLPAMVSELASKRMAWEEGIRTQLKEVPF